MTGKKVRSRGRALVCAAVCAAVLGGCIGVSAEMTLRADGSGTAVVEYRMARGLAALGSLDGNERWLTAPVGRVDFERTMKRVPGLSLRSFSSREEGGNLVVKAELEFSSLDALLEFFDGAGGRAVYTQDGGDHRLLLTLAGAARDGGENAAVFRELASRAAAGYETAFRFNLPAEGTLRLLDAEGGEIPVPPGASVQSRGKTVSCRLPLAAVLEAENGLVLEAAW